MVDGSADGVFRLPRRLADEIIAHAKVEVPNECCGILGGKDGEILRLWRATNAEHSPFRYRVDDRELFQIYREIDGNGWSLAAIYHSHVRSEAYPSPTDISLAAWPDAVYLLVSLREPEAPVLRGYHIQNGQVTEAALEVIEGA
ncbi:MAG TPA: M67 family metallopeptidase [Dehalococcoidia bacterium]|nr:M67 family metallopeptidase [Dehalococcoidia bacterium]